VLYCSDCAELNALPELPFNCWVYSGQALEFSKWTIELEELRADPKEFLLKLGQDYLLRNQPFPNIYYKENGEFSVAIDIGGVRRDFISQLMKGVFGQDKEAKGQLHINKEGYPVAQEDEQNHYRSLARIFTLCYLGVSNFTTGPLFSDKTFKWLLEDSAVKSLLEIRNANPQIAALTEEGDLNLSTFSDDVLYQAACFIEEEDSTPDLRDLFQSPSRRQQLKARLEELIQNDPQMRALNYVQGELKASLTETMWAQAIQEGAIEFAARIQGRLSHDLLIQKLVYLPGEGINNESKKRSQEMLETWIKKQDLETLREFVFAVTGNRCLAKEDIKVTLPNCSANRMPSSHTCFFTLDLPPYPNQETLDAKMLYLIKNGGFQMA